MGKEGGSSLKGKKKTRGGERQQVAQPKSESKLRQQNNVCREGGARDTHWFQKRKT